MVEVIVKEIGTQVKAKNTYFNNFAVNAIQMPNGEVVTNPYGDEPNFDGITDCQGIAFYIRIEPKATVSRAFRQLSSDTKSSIAKQRCHLVAFAFEHEKEIDSDKWVDRLARCLLDLDKTTLLKNATIEIAEKNASHIDTFFEETKKRFNVTKKFNCVKVSFDVLYDIVLTDCEYCDIFKDC